VAGLHKEEWPRSGRSHSSHRVRPPNQIPHRSVASSPRVPTLRPDLAQRRSMASSGYSHIRPHLGGSLFRSMCLVFVGRVGHGVSRRKSPKLIRLPNTCSPLSASSRPCPDRGVLGTHITEAEPAIDASPVAIRVMAAINRLENFCSSGLRNMDNASCVLPSAQSHFLLGGTMFDWLESQRERSEEKMKGRRYESSN
jgi:hypothetical protein